MSEWINWVVTTGIGLMIAIISYYFKKTAQETSDAIRGLDSRIADLEEKMTKLPFVYTMRDDFIRAMSNVENKLNKILDRLPAVKGE